MAKGEEVLREIPRNDVLEVARYNVSVPETDERKGQKQTHVGVGN